MEDQLINRLINTWDGDEEELLALVQLINRIRARAIESTMQAERERVAPLLDALQAHFDRHGTGLWPDLDEAFAQYSG